LDLESLLDRLRAGQLLERAGGILEGFLRIALGLVTSMMGLSPPAVAGSEDGNVMIRVLGTVVDPDTEATVRAGGAVIPGADADVSTEVIPALTLGYFFNKNLALELFLLLR
jgi:outer membrane protein